MGFWGYLSNRKQKFIQIKKFNVKAQKLIPFKVPFLDSFKGFPYWVWGLSNNFSKNSILENYIFEFQSKYLFRWTIVSVKNFSIVNKFYWVFLTKIILKYKKISPKWASKELPQPKLFYLMNNLKPKLTQSMPIWR